MEQQSFSFQRAAWGVLSLAIGFGCWFIGDGKSLGVNPPIQENAKLAITLLGWPFIIDGVRMIVGYPSFMRHVYRYGFRALCWVGAGALAVFAAMWTYDALSLKALVAVGLTATVALLVLILRELRATRGFVD
jgi:hypothetical protein